LVKKPKVASWYDPIIKAHGTPRPLLRNCLVAFIFGGALCAVAEYFQLLISLIPGISDKDASSIVMVIVIALAALLTGLGVFDKIAQQVGAGLAVPITGFANSITSSTLEFKSEGYVLGSGCNGFKLAGAVIFFGIGSAVVVALIELILGIV